MNRPIILVDDARPQAGRMLAFHNPEFVIRADRPGDVPGALAGIESALAHGKHVAGYASYELGYLLEPRLASSLPGDRRVPLLWFGAFNDADVVAADAYLQKLTHGRAYAGPLQHEWDEAAYAARFRRVHDFIVAGDIYQANLSFRSRFTFAGDALALYGRLRERSAAEHCAYIDDGERHILSLSPELFFMIDSSGRITAKPMKGTAPRGNDPVSDAAARVHLRASDKERAENLMIVDLLRNDIGRIARVGTVAVEDLFAIETYPTVHQMVSTVAADIPPDVRASGVLRALFPCGSITGAPKIRAMEIIRELESSPRGVYCGAIGYFAPDGSAKFNVAIRTLTISGNRGELGIGGAVVQDSRSESEYAECLLKARYFETARAPLELIETLRWSPGEGFVRIDRHLARMRASARDFEIPFDGQSAQAALNGATALCAGAMRVRLALAEDGSFTARIEPFNEDIRRWRCAISGRRVSSGDMFLRHKTNRRGFFEAELAEVAAAGCDEVVFLNERGELTEGSRTNIFVRLNGMLFTPPLSCGLLNGCLRQELVETGACTEAIVTASDLKRAEAVHVGNSLRGLIPAEFVVLKCT